MIRAGYILLFVFIPMTACFSGTQVSESSGPGVSPWLEIQKALDDAVNSNDDGVTRQLVQKARDAALTLPDSVRVGFRYVSWSDSQEGMLEDTTAVNIRWMKHALSDAAASDPVDTMRVRFLRDQLAAFVDSWNAVQMTVLEESDEPYAARVRTILERAEFHEAESRNVLSEYLSKAIRWLFEWLQKLFENVSPEPETPAPPMDFSVFGKVLLYVLYGFGVVLLGWLLFRVWAHFRNPRGKDSENKGTVLEGLLEPGETTEPDEHRRLAERWAAEGDYRRAIRHLFLSALLHLDQEHMVRYHRPWTNREFLEAVRGHEQANVRDIADHLERLARMFDRKWYGQEAASGGDFRQCEDDRAVVMQASERETHL